MAIAWAVTFAAVAVQGVIGFGMALVSVPVLSLVDGTLAPVPQLVVALPLVVLMTWRERGHIDVHGLWWVMAGRFPGAAIGVGLLLIATERTLGVMIALTVLGATAIVASGIRIRRNRAASFIAGTAAGIAGLVASVGGPPLALIYHREEGPVIRASLGVIFIFGLSVTIVARAAAGEFTMAELQVGLLLLPSMLLGLWASRSLTARVEGAPLRAAILMVSAAASIVVLIRSLAG
jgi:uncharacterized membrane protein YfcA